MAEGKRAWHQDPEFLKLRREWYGRAKKSGFRDIEIHNWRDGSTWERTYGFSQMDGLKAGLHEDRGQLNADFWYRAKQYQRCVARKHGRTSFEYQVWRRWAAGAGPGKIAKALGCGAWRVEDCVKKLRARMERWLARELRAQEREQQQAVEAELRERGLAAAAGLDEDEEQDL